MNVYYPSFSVFNFSLKLSKTKTENSEHFYATVVKKYSKKIKNDIDDNIKSVIL